MIRYDNRDTGRSMSYPPGRPGYTLADLARDAVGVLDVLGIGRAHVVGRSMAGAIALAMAVDHPDRVASVTFVSTTTGGGDLPPIAAILPASVPDTADRAAVVRYVVEVMRAYAGDSPFFDAAATTALAEQGRRPHHRHGRRADQPLLIEFDAPASGGIGDVAVPALVVHGALDPVFPLAHGEALYRAMPGAELLVLDRAGHDLPRECHDVVVDAFVRVSAADGPEHPRVISPPSALAADRRTT